MSGIFYAPFERRLNEPFRYGGRELLSRKGFLLSRGGPGEGEIAEASPLPGHSPDSLEQVQAALEGNGPRTAALEFALSCLGAPEAGPHEVQSNCLVPWRGLEGTLSAVESFLCRGFTHCKLKVSPENAGEIPPLIEKFPRARFRLDANQSLNPELLAALLRALETKGLLSSVDYLEEPYAGFWNQAPAHPGVSYAADESAPTALLSPRNRPSVLVLKPSVQGSLGGLAELMQKLEKVGVRAVITSALEAEPGRRAILRFLSRRAHEVAGMCAGFLFEESFFPDSPVFPSLPEPSKQERAWIASLPWKESAL